MDGIISFVKGRETDSELNQLVPPTSLRAVADSRRWAEEMNIPAILFGVYFGVGLILMIVAMASPGKERRGKRFTPAGTGDIADAVLLIFVALLWPLWLISLLGKKEPK